jgi:hypothetical protein
VNQDLQAEFGSEASVIELLPTPDDPPAPEIAPQETKTAEQLQVDEKANEAATSPENDRTDPTEAQKLAGNYKKGKLTFAGVDVAIENPAGSTRSGTSPDGSSWSNTMQHHYGDVVGTKGADGDPIDVFLGDELEPENVFIIDQIDPATRKFDEHKVMLGFASAAAAKAAYLANYDKGWQGVGAVSTMTLDEFKSWASSGAKTSALQYQDGDFPEAPAREQIPTLNPENYVNMKPLELKHRMLSAHRDGYPEPEIIEVFDYWLTKNVSNGEYVRPDMAA